MTVYSDDSYTLGQKNDRQYLIAGGKEYVLSCHPYEPCLYITDENGSMTAVHNAFDPFYVLESFSRGETVTSITGCEYTEKDFCRMVEYAADMFDIQIDEAEKVLGRRPVQKKTDKNEQEKAPVEHMNAHPEDTRCPDDPFYSLIAEYPDSVVDFCIVSGDHSFPSYANHWMALLWGFRKLFVPEDGESEWSFDLRKADAEKCDPAELFAPSGINGNLNYKKAFLCPPHGCPYTESDFDRINSSLFPNGTEELEVYRWTTDWSDYFDEGHEWWGTLCCTVYDRSLDRFVVILASATD